MPNQKLRTSSGRGKAFTKLTYSAIVFFSSSMAVSMYPTTMEQLLALADAGAIMPPKSTWFEPKLLSGLFVHTLG